jgi:hypothetical protein
MVGQDLGAGAPTSAPTPPLAPRPLLPLSPHQALAGAGRRAAAGPSPAPRRAPPPRAAAPAAAAAASPQQPAPDAAPPPPPPQQQQQQAAPSSGGNGPPPGAQQPAPQFRALQTSSGGRTPLKYASPWGAGERRAALVSRVRDASTVEGLVSVWAANRQLLGPTEVAVMFHQLARVADPSRISLKALEMSRVGLLGCFGRFQGAWRAAIIRWLARRAGRRPPKRSLFDRALTGPCPPPNPHPTPRPCCASCSSTPRTACP